MHLELLKQTREAVGPQEQQALLHGEYTQHQLDQLLLPWQARVLSLDQRPQYDLGAPGLSQRQHTAQLAAVTREQRPVSKQ